MQIQVDIGFDDLLEIVKKLPEDQLLRLQHELEQNYDKKETDDLESFLLSGPTFSEEQIKTIEETRKALNRWQTK